MKATQIPITSGPACGTLVTRVESNSGKLLGFIRVVNVDWTPSYGCTQYFIVNRESCFKPYICSTLMDAYLYLGVSVKELDRSDIGKLPYEESNRLYWKYYETKD